MNTIYLLTEFIKDIKAAETVNRDIAVIELISNRLDKCLDTYITALNKDVDYLEARNHIRLMRKLSK